MQFNSFIESLGLEETNPQGQPQLNPPCPLTFSAASHRTWTPPGMEALWPSLCSSSCARRLCRRVPVNEDAGMGP